jgi:hypothetical protein
LKRTRRTRRSRHGKNLLQTYSFRASHSLGVVLDQPSSARPVDRLLARPQPCRRCPLGCVGVTSVDQLSIFVVRRVLAFRSSTNTGLQNGRQRCHLGCCARYCCLIRLQISTSSSPWCNHRNSLHLSIGKLAFSGALTGSGSGSFSRAAIR